MVRTKKSQIKKSDGWVVEDYCDMSALENIRGLDYEIRNCVKGSYTDCYTYSELADYIRTLADDLRDFASDVEGCEDYDDDEDDEIEESAKKSRVKKSNDSIFSIKSEYGDEIKGHKDEMLAELNGIMDYCQEDFSVGDKFTLTYLGEDGKEASTRKSFNSMVKSQRTKNRRD